MCEGAHEENCEQAGKHQPCPGMACFHPTMTSDTILVQEVVINPLPKFHFSIEFHPVPYVMIICHLVHNNNETL